MTKSRQNTKSVFTSIVESEEASKDQIINDLRGKVSMLKQQVEDTGSTNISLNRPTTSSLLPLASIQTRPQDTRPLNEAHVAALVESITVLGLIQPIAVDSQGVLLAGGHRREAIERLQNSNPEAFTEHFGAGVPVRSYDFDSSQDPDRALAIEATENEKRRDYTASEVKELADRLKAAGYHHSNNRPKEGAKLLLPSLAVIVGKSERQIQRYLSEENEQRKLSTTHVVLSQKYLNQAVSALRRYEKLEFNNAKERKLAKEVAEIIARLEEAIDPKLKS
jgi:ParB family transcriptional regulator, chromosome partitioning protein